MRKIKKRIKPNNKRKFIFRKKLIAAHRQRSKHYLDKKVNSQLKIRRITHILTKGKLLSLKPRRSKSLYA